MQDMGSGYPGFLRVVSAKARQKGLCQLYTEYPQIAQLGLFESVDAALKALAPKPQPKQIVEPEPTPEPEQQPVNSAARSCHYRATNSL